MTNLALEPEMVSLLVVDAFGKQPSNLDRGHVQWVGSYDQCRAVTKRDTSYCIVRLGSSDDLVSFECEVFR